MTSNPLTNFFSEFRLPLNRGNENIQTFLANHFEKFNSVLASLLNNNSDQQIYSMLERNKKIIEELSATILAVLEKHHQGNILQAHQIFEEQISKIEDQLVSSDIKGRGVLNHFYRIRPDEGNKRKDLFHIPFHLTTKAGAYRYSIAGVPSLYLSTDIPLCWFESGLPNQFYWSEFVVAEQADNIPLIDFTWTPFRSATNAHRLSTPSALNSEPTNEFTAKMITTYPLMSACSLSIIDKRDKFIPEYVIPQMLLGWVRKNSKYRGIAYFSSSANIETRKHTAFNVVLPPVIVDDTGYCERLKREFKLSAPQKVNVSGIFNSFLESSLQIRESQKRIETIYREFGFKLLENVILQCEVFFIAYRQLSNSKTEDLTFPYQCVNLLDNTIEQFISLKYSYEDFARRDLDLDFRSDTYREKAKAAWIQSWGEIKKIKDTLWKFHNIEWRHFTSTGNCKVFCFIDDEACDLSESI